MSSPLDSAIGIYPQTDGLAGNANVAETNGDFLYALFERSSMSPIEVQRAIPRLAGSTRSLPRGFVKTGVYSGGDVDLLLGPEVMGWFLLGLMGQAAAPTGTYSHRFSFNTDEFDIPYMTVRRRVAGLWHEQFQDVRITSFVMRAPAVDMVRFNVGMVGRAPQIITNAGNAWDIASQIDDGNPFLTCTATLTTDLGGTFNATNIVVSQVNALALDEEWIIGSYFPSALTLGGRSMTIQCDIHADAEMFGKMAYDPDYTSGAQEWTPDILSNSDFKLIVSTQDDTPYSLELDLESENENVDWVVQPVGVRAADNRQLMRVTGIVKQSSGSQLAWVLTNGRATQYAVPT